MLVAINRQNPQPRLIRKAVEVLREGGIIIYPTDTVYGLGCDLFNKRGIEKIYEIKKRNKKQPFSFVCADLKDISRYALVSNYAYKTMKRLLPGPYTFILEASKEVPRRVSHPSRKTIGLRVPEHKALQELLALHNGPLLATTLIAIGETDPLNDAHEIRDRYEHQVGAVIDAGACALEPTTVVDLTGGDPVIIRQGRGDIAALGL